MQNDETTAIIKQSNVFDINDVIHDFRVNFLNEIACREWVLKRLHPSGAYCPGCGVAIPEKSLQRFWMSERVKCCQCDKFFTALTGTFLTGCQLDYREVLLLAVLLSPDMTDKTIAEILEMSAANVSIWRNKFKALGKLKNG
jgi:transposase-like protein